MVDPIKGTEINLGNPNLFPTLQCNPAVVYGTHTEEHDKKRQSLLWPGAFQWRIYYTTECVVNYQLLSVLKQPNEEPLVAADHNQLRTMASETIDPIDWSHPSPSCAVPPERLLHNLNRCSLSRESTLQSSACDSTTLPVRPINVKVTYKIQACGHRPCLCQSHFLEETE